MLIIRCSQYTKAVVVYERCRDKRRPVHSLRWNSSCPIENLISCFIHNFRRLGNSTGHRGGCSSWLANCAADHGTISRPDGDVVVCTRLCRLRRTRCCTDCTPDSISVTFDLILWMSCATLQMASLTLSQRHQTRFHITGLRAHCQDCQKHQLEDPRSKHY